MKAPALTPVTSFITEGLVARKDLAAALGCCERTVRRFELRGMPHVCLGAKRLYEPAKIRAWVLSLERRLGPVAAEHQHQQAA